MCAHILMHAYICMHIHTFSHAHLHSYEHTFVHTHSHTHICVHTHSYAHIHFYANTLAHTHLHAHSYTLFVCARTFAHTPLHAHTFAHTHSHTRQARPSVPSDSVLGPDACRPDPKATPQMAQLCRGSHSKDTPTGACHNVPPARRQLPARQGPGSGFARGSLLSFWSLGVCSHPYCTASRGMTQQTGKRVSRTRLGLEPACAAGAPGAAHGACHARPRSCVADVRPVTEPAVCTGSVVVHKCDRMSIVGADEKGCDERNP